jgi:NOL1/NOP2/sun family putative RNA methylase
MSGKPFFTDRYEKLGWEFKEIHLKRAIRINTMNAEKTDVLERLRSQGVKLEKIPFLENGIWIQKSRFSVGATNEYLLGSYSIQEAAAQIPATLFTNLKDKLVLDACAAPGGKTIQLADLMQNSDTIVALDVEKRRLMALANHLERCRVCNTIVYRKDARQVSELGIKFDRILLDVPCSGNFAADKEWFNRRTLQDVEKNSELQKAILAEAAKVLKDDGEIVYSTCSLEPEENELNVDWAMRKLALRVEDIDCYGEHGLAEIFGKRLDSSIEKCRRIWPSLTQGFFICKFKKERLA